MNLPRRVLLDECVPATLKRHLPGFDVQTVRGRGWASKLNGELLRSAESEFDVFVTVARNLVHQQNLGQVRIAVVVLIAFSKQRSGPDPTGSGVAEGSGRGSAR